MQFNVIRWFSLGLLWSLSPRSPTTTKQYQWNSSTIKNSYCQQSCKGPTALSFSVNIFSFFEIISLLTLKFILKVLFFVTVDSWCHTEFPLFELNLFFPLLNLFICANIYTISLILLNIYLKKLSFCSSLIYCCWQQLQIDCWIVFSIHLLTIVKPVVNISDL